MRDKGFFGLVTVLVPVESNGKSGDSVIQSIDLRGDGGAIEIEVPVTQLITSTGP